MERKNALKRDWYIRRSYPNPSTGRMGRQKNIYGPDNQYGTHKKRIQVLNTLKRNLKKILDSWKSSYDEQIVIAYSLADYVSSFLFYIGHYQNTLIAISIHLFPDNVHSSFLFEETP